MITLVSYPRSGNTFFRNVLFEVWGIRSSTYHLEAHGADSDWKESAIVKTHLLPDQLPPSLLERKIVYLVRDGRDAAISLAHHRKDVFEAESNFHQNLKEVTYAAEGSHFSGWSNHVKTWARQADLIVRFEELIKNPIEVCQRLAAFIPLENPRLERLPSFEALKHGQPEYGSGKYINRELASKWFRKGKVNGWKVKMTKAQHHLFWHLHGETLETFGYGFDGERNEICPLISQSINGKAIYSKNNSVNISTKVAIEGSKLADMHVDGIKRYVTSLLKAARDYPVSAMEIQVYVNGKSYSLDQALTLIELPPQKNKGLVEQIKGLLKAVLTDSAYHAIARRFPLARFYQWRSNWTSKAENEEENHVYDAALLPLPQNFMHIAGLKYTRLITVVHDITHLLFPSFHEKNNVALTERGMEFSKDKDASFLSVSESTQLDCQKVGIETKISLEGVDRTIFFPVYNQHLLAWVSERYTLPKGKFLLSVSTLEPRKNTERLVAAYCKLPKKVREEYALVLAGMKGWKWKDVLIPEDCRNQVKFTGFVQEEHLPALYTLASGFCYVSLYEGFGLPILEAMACGCPVLVSNTSSMPELVQETGVLCAPEEEASIRSGLSQLIEKSKEEGVSDVMMKQTWQFTWARHWNAVASMIMEVTD